MEFHEYRAYTPGDSPALVDWRVFARSDRLQLRTFQLETHLECHVFLDASASMGFDDGGPSKMEWACHFAACLAYLVTLKQDRVSLTVFDERPRAFLPPGGTAGHLRQFLRTLEGETAGHGTDLPEALKRSLPLIKHRGTLVILSDFLCDPEALYRALAPYAHRGFRVFLFQILTPTEWTLPGTSPRRYLDPESGKRLTANAETVREAYLAELTKHQRQLAALASRRGMGFVQVRTDQSWLEHLRRLTR